MSTFSGRMGRGLAALTFAPAPVGSLIFSGGVGGIQGLTPNLTGADPSGPLHDSAMTHAFAVSS